MFILEETLKPSGGWTCKCSKARSDLVVDVGS